MYKIAANTTNEGNRCCCYFASIVVYLLLIILYVFNNFCTFVANSVVYIRSLDGYA